MVPKWLENSWGCDLVSSFNFFFSLQKLWGSSCFSLCLLKEHQLWRLSISPAPGCLWMQPSSSARQPGVGGAACTHPALPGSCCPRGRPGTLWLLSFYRASGSYCWTEDRNTLWAEIISAALIAEVGTALCVHRVSRSLKEERERC